MTDHDVVSPCPSCHGRQIDVARLRKLHQKQLDRLAAQRQDVESRLGEAVELLQDRSHDSEWTSAVAEFCRRCGMTPAGVPNRTRCVCGREITRGDRCQLCRIELAREFAKVASGKTTR